MNLKHFVAVVSVLAVSMLPACGNAAPAEISDDSSNTLTGVKVNTSVRKTGQYPESFVLNFENDL